MKIALVIFHADPARGGAERYTLDLAAALASRGHAASLLASSFAEVPQTVRQVQLAAPGLSRAARYLRFLDSLDLHLSQEKYDIVHAMLPVRRCDVYHPHAGIAQQAVRTGHLKHTNPVRRTLAAIFNRVNRRRNLFAETERSLLTGQGAPMVLCLSDYIKAEVRRQYPRLAPGRLATLFNAVDLAKFDPDRHSGKSVRRQFNIGDSSVVGLMIAQDFARKGLGEALAAVGAINDPRLTLLVVGKEDPSPWQRRARVMSIEKRVIFAGPTTDPASFYAAADFFLLPTHHDPCSLVVLEALAMGLPVISTRNNGACEIMTDGVHGRVLGDASDVAALASAIRDVLEDSARRPMRLACRELRPRLAYETHLDALESIYSAARAMA